MDNRPEKQNVITGPPIKNFFISEATGNSKTTAELRSRIGLKEYIIRQSNGHCCDWCQRLVGVYVYGEEPQDVYRRHDNCTCVVLHKSQRGYRDVHNRTQDRIYKTKREAIQDNIRRREELVNKKHHDKIGKRRKEEDYIAGEKAAIRRLRKIYDSGEFKDEFEKERIRRIISGKWSLKQRKQKYLQHCEDTPQYKSATKERETEQSYLTISDEEAQALILKYAGTGVSSDKTNGEVTSEFVTVGENIGFYYEGGKEHPTNRIQITYSNKGVHIIPVKIR